MEWYNLKKEEVFEKLGASPEGLSDAEAADRLQKYGPNIFAKEEKINKLKILLHQFASPLIYILLIAAGVTIIIHEYIDSGVILAIVILNAVIGYMQEFKAEESMRALKKMVMPKAYLIRNGEMAEVESEKLVPGDVAVLSSGSKVPADMRLFEVVELRVEEAALTGESVPVEKHTMPIESENITYGDQNNMAFMGTIVVSGRAKGVIVETGRNTVLGKIAKDVKEVKTVKTPLQSRLEKFAKIVGLFVVGFSIILLAMGVFTGVSLSEMFMVAVATAVSAIPEGLPVAVTIAMAIGVARMSRKNAIVRKLPAVETLGSTTVIGSDKTGTLTKNEMTVKSVCDGNECYEVTGSGYEPEGEFIKDKKVYNNDLPENLKTVLRIGLLCNESGVSNKSGYYKVDGDPTEGALIISALKAGIRKEEERKKYAQKAILPFESERGFMATLNEHGGKKYIFIKGSPEKIADICEECLAKGKYSKENVLRASEELAKRGLRVLAMAYKEVEKEVNEISVDNMKKGLVFAGLQGMIDPPRNEVIDAIRESKQAGIRVVMITGDHAITALAIGKMLGLADEKSGYLTGKEIDGMSEDELYKRVKDTNIYARVSPQHKLLIVKQLIKYGEIVAVTGDGVNDAPALKMAHIGVAMGRTGTDVAKESSDMVLTDDNFVTIVSAVEEGRVVYDNIKKVTLFLVSCGLGELISIFVTIITGNPIPYIPAQILWLNLVTNGLQDLALVFEPAEPGIMKRKPRNPKEGILSKLMVQRTLLMGVILAAGTLFIFFERLSAGVSLERARTAALTTMVFLQFFQALNCRSETQSVFKMDYSKNLFLIFSLVAAFFAQLAVIYIPALQWVFRTEPISPSVWIEIILISSTIIAGVEIDKFIRRKKSQRLPT